MAQEDLKALIVYLRTLKPVKKVTPVLITLMPFARIIDTRLFHAVFGRFSKAPAQAPKSGLGLSTKLGNTSPCAAIATQREISWRVQSIFLHGRDE